MSSAIQLEMKGLDKLQTDINAAAQIAPKEMAKGLNKIGTKLKTVLKQDAKRTYKTTQHITSGFYVSKVNVKQDKLYADFQPEAVGKSGHAWHLQEFGHMQIIPTYWSVKRKIKNKNGGKPAKVLINPTKGHDLVGAEVDDESSKFNQYADKQFNKTLDDILKKV